MAAALFTSSIYFDSTTQTSLNSAQSKSSWASVINTALGPTRAIKITRYANAQDAADNVNGVVRFAATNTGALKLSSGDLVGFGSISKVTTGLGVDFSSGFHVLSFEGSNGRRMYGAIGLSPAAQVAAGVAAGSEVTYCFTLGANLAANNGLALRNITIFAPKLMPSGIGPAAPALTDNAPAIVEHWNWTNPSSPVMTSSVTLDRRMPDFTFEHPILAQENGDIRVDTSSVTLKAGKFQFGVMRTVQAHDGAEPLYQIVVNIQAYNTNWANQPTYPMLTGYDRKTDETHPDPFKIVVKNKFGQVLTDSLGRTAIQQRDGLPMCSPDMHQRFDLDKTKPLRPHVKIGDTLIWENKRPKDSSVRGRFFNGIADDSLRESRAKARGTCNPSEPMDSAYDQQDSFMHMHFMPQWPLAGNNPSWCTQARIDDPFMWDENGKYNSNRQVQWCGWDYEPGSRSGNDVYNGKGGPRFDRSCIPSILAWYVSRPDAIRAAGKVPVRDMAHAWRMAYHNNGFRLFKSGPNWESAWTTADAQTGNMQTLETYYYANGLIVDASKAFDMVTAGNASSYGDSQRGPTGRLVYNGRAFDHLHAYHSSAWAGIIFKDPANAILSKHDYNMLWAVSIGERTPYNLGGPYVRSHAWRILHYTNAWLMGSKHPLGMPTAAVEARLQIELETTLYGWYKRAVIDNEQTFEMKVLRGFGELAGRVNYREGRLVLSVSGDIGKYMSHALLHMKGSGLFDVMYAKNVRCATVLRWMVDCLDKQCVEMMAATGGYPYADEEFSISGTYVMYMRIKDTTYPENLITLADCPANWREWAAKYPPKNLESFVTFSDGSIKRGEAGMNLLSQWILAREWAFPEFPHPDIPVAVAKMKQQLAEHAQRVAAITNLQERCEKDGLYHVPSHGQLKPFITG